MKLAQFALDGFVSFTSLPLKVWSYFGGSISSGALTYAVYFIVYTLLFDADLPGFPSLIVSIMLFARVQLVSLGVIGEYLARIYEEVKGRPLYIVSQEIGIRGEKSPGQLKAEHEVGRMKVEGAFILCADHFAISRGVSEGISVSCARGKAIRDQRNCHGPPLAGLREGRHAAPL